MKMKETAKKIQLTPLSTALKTPLIAALLVTVFVVSVMALHLDIAKFQSRLANIGKTLSHFVAFDIPTLPKALLEMLSSISLGIGALAIGSVISLALSFLAAANTTPNRFLAASIKGGIALIRAVPALVWVLMVIASIGFGNTSGLVGLLFPTCGYLIKSFIASIEDKGMGTIEALQATGAGWFEIMLFGVLPGLLTSLLSWTSMRLEHNIAESISLGMVGVSGVGSMLMRALGNYHYAEITTITVVIFVTMLTVELAVGQVRKKLNGDTTK
ncbi:MAG: ABC transporter permease subunit [Propionibacteriaceae bacterium]|jgi:phosphonate transport system permease protein|nr:ABC transporter permease subunit [Propionibacteriaceae bacterium]